MDEDEEDKHLFSRLGVTSANPEDIEHDLLKVDNDGAENSQKPEAVEENNKDASSSIEILLRKKLRAINVEINAVASTIGHGKTANASEGNTSDTDFTGGDMESGDDFVQRSSKGYSVQKSVATERLISLEKTKGQLQFEIDKLNNDAALRNHGNSKLVTNLVKELPKKKQKAKESNPSVGASEQRRITFAEDDDFDAVMDAAATGFAETERDELIRKGFLTPFHKLKGFERRVQLPEPAVKPHMSTEDDNENIASSSIARVAQSMSDIAKARPTTILLDSKSLPTLDGPTHSFQRLKTPLKRPASPESVSEKKNRKEKKLKRPLPDRKWIKRVTQEGKLSKGTGGYEGERSVPSDSDAEYPEEEDSDSGRSCVVLEGGLKIPEGIFSNLFDYQRIGVQWLWELHCQRAGGIIGDEMGLGKTVQVISFLASLHFSGMYKPSIVICPVTLLRQWQREARKWYPKFDVEILHDSARSSIAQQPSKSSESDYDSEDASLDDENGRVVSGKSNKRWDCLIDRVLKSESGVLLTTYEQLRLLADKLLDIEWGYAVLDEGHRIRNPNAEITLVCKQLQTVHRIIMTGAPIQNKLSELWSLFDFIFPGKLGVLPVFETEFAVPITVGGYANATPLQVSTAYRCAVVLRDLVMPYLLRRMKTDVNARLPKKTEQVLFCSLTSDQRSIYRAFLASSDVEQIFDGSRNSLYGIDIMRKICNHPDLLEREHCGHHSDYGNPERSGKMKVVAQILGVWKEQGHRVLIFTQTQQMLDIFAKFLTASGYIYRRMDGLTPVRQRMALIDEYNNTSDIFVFILTTKVGGLGTNLTGANRVIIYDPDWNPSTDMQARERAWRIGQTKDVTIYRLITRGTIEEKVYHRQIYKHFLTNKILKNPQQKRFFKARDMRDLFTLQDDERDFSTETSTIFAQLPNDVSVGVNSSDLNIQNPEAGSADAETDNNLRTSNMKMKSKGKDIADQNGCTDNGVDVLKSLLDANGIHSALNHDAIMNANDDDRIKMEEQASLVAQRAAEALRHSRMRRGRESFALPTWTGKAGAAGAPSSVRRKFGSTLSTNIVGSRKLSFEGSSSHSPGLHAGASTGKALSSAEILARTREKQEMASTHGFEKQSVSPSTSSSAGAGQSSRDNQNKRLNKVSIVQPEILIRQLCTFIQQHGGSADSSSIVLHFKESILPKDLPIFRSLLKEIALLEKGADGTRWVLKPEYRD